MITNENLSVPGLANDAAATTSATRVPHRTIQADGVDVFYREAGPDHSPALLLLHGFSTLHRCFAS